VIAPIEARALQAELDAAFEALLKDSRQAWNLEPDGTWRRIASSGKRPRTAHETLMSRARSRSRRPARPSA